MSIEFARNRELLSRPPLPEIYPDSMNKAERRRNWFSWLVQQQKRENPFPYSENLEKNPLSSTEGTVSDRIIRAESYVPVQEPFQISPGQLLDPSRITVPRPQEIPRQILAVNAGLFQPPAEWYYEDVKSDQHLFFEEPDPNTGYKLSLNIGLRDVNDVAAYLRKEHYRFKYLSGTIYEGLNQVTGIKTAPYCAKSLSEGKVFTLYTGSHDMTIWAAQLLSKDLGSTLRKPEDSRQLEFAPGVTGRFVVRGKKEFTHYPDPEVRGVPLLEDISKETPPAEKLTAVYNKLANEYGNYFYGGHPTKQ